MICNNIAIYLVDQSTVNSIADYIVPKAANIFSTKVNIGKLLSKHVKIGDFRLLSAEL